MPKMGNPKEVLSGGRLKGGMIKSHLTWLQENHPEDKEKVLAALKPETRAAIGTSVLSTNWYPFAHLMDLDRQLMTFFGGGKLDFLRELGKYSARINLSTTYRAFNRDTNHDFFRNSALLHSQFQDFGSAKYEETGERSGKMVHSGYEVGMSPIFCASALGYYEGCITSHGATDAVVVETTCQCYGDSSCTYEMNWKG